MRDKLAGEKTYLRLLELDDLSNRVKWINDPVVQRSLHYDYPTSLARTAKWFDKIVMDRTRVEFTIFSKIDNDAIGFGGLINVCILERKAELHMVIGKKDCWGGGYGTDAYKLVINYGFHEMGLNRIYGYQNVDNDAAFHVVSKLGWKKEGTLRKDTYAHGKLYDRKIVSILRTEWECNSIYDF